MSNKEYNEYKAMAVLGLLPDEENPIFAFSQTHRDILLDIANGKIDVVQLAKVELRNRGLDEQTGKWIGWKNKSTEDVLQ